MNTRRAGAAAVALLTFAALVQIAMALGPPLGDAVLGGRAATEDGALADGLRLLALVQAALLFLMAWIVAARAGLATAGPLTARALGRAAWGVVVLMTLNTAGNLSSAHPLERWGMGGLTALVAGLTAVVARGPKPSADRLVKAGH